jgi:hypothetical protein
MDGFLKLIEAVVKQNGLKHFIITLAGHIASEAAR